MQKQKGFTLIELLVVIAIVGVLASIILVTTGNARLKSRDARRLSDIQQIKSGLDIYFSLGSGYPSESAWDTAQSSAGNLSCSSTIAFKVPQDPFNSAGGAYAYTYTPGGNSFSGCGGTVHTNYKVQFVTEGQTGLGGPNTYYLSPGGISTTAPF